jgi:nucleoside-diphosphate-sugar epimerase
MSRTIAFLGATGGCAGACLVASLKEGYTCRALVRTPSKLTTFLNTQGLPESLLANLEVIQGNAKDAESVKASLQTSTGIVDTIVFGVGAAPRLRLHIMPVSLDDVEVCRTAMATLLSALDELKAATKPRLLVISTTGITKGPRDVPLLYVPLYHWFLHIPHIDKRVMEQLVCEQRQKPASERTVGEFAIVRPTLLMNGNGVGVAKVRYGLESKPALGWTIDRKDVGNWLFEEGVKPADLGGFKDQAVSLTS